MASSVPNHYAQQFATEVQLLLQQQGSVLMPGVTVRSGYRGEQASPVDQYGAIQALTVTGRYEPMPNVEATTDRRWVLPTDKHLPQLLDSFDELRLINDPKGKYVQNALNAIGREYDSELISKFFGTNMTGKSGSTSTSFGTGQSVAVATGAAAANGLTVAKLKAGKKVLRQNNVNFGSEEIICVLNGEAHDSLLNDVLLISRDYNGGGSPLAMDKIPDGYMGISRFIHTELLTNGTDDASGQSRQIMLYCKSALHLGIWDDMRPSISQRNDLTGEPWQCYVRATFGATRLEEKKCVRIWCRE